MVPRGNQSKSADVCTSFLQSSELAVDLCEVALVTINVLPDLALLTIFGFYMDDKKIETWQTLVHVCKKWRNIVFGSPRHLKLRLCCTGKQRRRKLDVWPPLPIVVRSDGHGRMDNIIAALKHNDRICGVHLDSSWMSSSTMEKVLAAMQQPFPALTSLELQGSRPPVISASFLGGSAPSLESLCLRNITFPGLPKLLLSATRLVNLQLQLLDIPASGYLSPETMVTTLSVLTKLEKFHFSFDPPPSRPRRKRQRQFPQTRTLLPALTGLRFEEAHQYFEDLMAQIDVPLLDDLYIFFSTLDTPPLTPFISRIIKSKPHNEAQVFFTESDVAIRFPDGEIKLEFFCEETEVPEELLSWAARLCSSSLPRSLISVVEHLYIETGEEWTLEWDLLDHETENGQWLELLRPFTSVKCLHITYGFEYRFARAMEGLIGESVTEVLPALQTLFTE